MAGGMRSQGYVDNPSVWIDPLGLSGCGDAQNVANYAKQKELLKTTEAANDVVASLRTTGKLPPHYVTKANAKSQGWEEGKSVNPHVPGGQLGGDVFKNSTGVLPTAPGRTWFEADIGLSNTITRAKQAGTRLLYSNDGLLYVTPDHYDTVHSIGVWK